jgi:dTMP kinase
MKPRFLVIEGLDGSGGTTQAARLAAWLVEHGCPEVVTTREPSDGPVGRFTRSALGDSDPAERIGDAVLPYLFAADRRDHLDRTVLPALERGACVVSDRYYHSSLAYQSLSMGLHRVAELNHGFLAPDLTVFLDLEPEVCLERILARGGTRDRFEELERLRLVRESYGAVIVLCRTRGERIARVDASGSRDAVFDQILSHVRPLLVAPEHP